MRRPRGQSAGGTGTSILANDEALEPWLDEGLASYVAGLLLDELFGANRSALDLGPVRLGNADKERLRMLARSTPAPAAAPGLAAPSGLEDGRG